MLLATQKNLTMRTGGTTFCCVMRVKFRLSSFCQVVRERFNHVENQIGF